VGDKIVIVIKKNIGGYWLQFNYRGVILDFNLLNYVYNSKLNPNTLDIYILQHGWYGYDYLVKGMTKIECRLLVNLSKIKYFHVNVQMFPLE
jgi:hypothetical protein